MKITKLSVWFPYLGGATKRGRYIWRSLRCIIKALSRSGIGGVKEDGSLFELEVPARVSSGGDRLKDISVKICGDGDCEGNEDILPYC